MPASLSARINSASVPELTGIAPICHATRAHRRGHGLAGVRAGLVLAPTRHRYADQCVTQKPADALGPAARTQAVLRRNELLRAKAACCVLRRRGWWFATDAMRGDEERGGIAMCAECAEHALNTGACTQQTKRVIVELTRDESEFWPQVSVSNVSRW